jgi:hypothetical protein
MKILRSVSRRGFSVGTAGWFTVLRPNTWFPASRLPKAARGFESPTKGAAETAEGQGALGGDRGQAKAVRWLAMERSAEDRHRIRSASAVLGALAITSAMLWWIMHP